MAFHFILPIKEIGRLITVSSAQDVAKRPVVGCGWRIRRYQAGRACRLAAGFYNVAMPKRTSPTDAEKISVAADLEELGSPAQVHFRREFISSQGYRQVDGDKND